MNTKALIVVFIFHSINIKSIKAIRNTFCHKEAIKGNFNCENIYIWKSDQGEFISLSNVKLSQPKKYNLNTLEGKTIRVVADNMKPYIIYSNKTPVLDGYLGEIWKIAEDSLKFKSDILSTNYDNGLQIISKGKTDVMLAAGVVKAGLKGVTYSQPYLQNWYHLYVKRPEGRGSSSSYLKTLSIELWYASSIVFVILTVVLWMTLKYLHSNFKIDPPSSIPACFITVFCGFLNQGFDLGVTSHSGRILIFFSFIPGYLLYCAINAVLVAKLAIITVDLPFKTLEDVQAIKKWSLCLRTNSFVYNSFAAGDDSNKTVFPQWKTIVNQHGCLNINDQENLAKILCNSGIVILENKVVMATVIKNFQIRCSITKADLKYFPKGNSYLMSENFKEIEPIETLIMLMKSSGVLDRLERKWITYDVNYVGDSKQQMSIPEVHFTHISGILSFYGGMIIVSLAILGIEILISKSFLPITKQHKHRAVNPFLK